jgi:CheY-like chemotaxis protein
MSWILLVEDNEMNRDMLRRRLKRAGFEVSEASDGLAALQMAGMKPDLVLLDMSIPEVDGWEVTRRLKADPATRRIPVIALTAHVMAGDRERALEAGCDEYETKPIDFQSLQEKIHRLLGGTTHRPGPP